MSFRRPGVGLGRRHGIRGIGGGAAAAFDPITIPNTTLLWQFDTEWVTQNSGNVSAIEDRSTSGADNDGTQGTATDQPAYTESDAAINGKGRCAFDGGSDVLVTTDDASQRITVDGLTIYLVMYTALAEASGYIFGRWAGTGASEWLAFLNSSGQLQFFVRDGAGTSQNIATDAVDRRGAWHIVRCRFDAAGNVAGIRVGNNSEATDGTKTGYQAGARDGVKLGNGAAAWAGRVAYTQLIQRYVTSDEDTQIMTYLQSEYGL